METAKAVLTLEVMEHSEGELTMRGRREERREEQRDERETFGRGGSANGYQMRQKVAIRRRECILGRGKLDRPARRFGRRF